MTASKRCLSLLLLLFAAGGFVATGARAAPVHHRLTVRVEPAEHLIEYEDRFELGDDPDVTFLLHADLKPELDGGRLEEVERLPAGPGSVPRSRWRLRPAAGRSPGAGSTEAVLRVRGRIHHPLLSVEQEYARSFSSTPGTIQDEGVVLGGASAWLPDFDGRLLTFEMSVDLPEGWDAVSQGARTQHELSQGRRLTTWTCEQPMEEVHLVAARFHEYSRPAGSVLAMAFLRSPDEALAAKYLEATAQYLEMYRQLLGPHPHPKFALVENFWETGYGMPSFTLLGSKVIRLPFILHSSYPHEILHDWWGNGVFVDYERGNWCEGLTAYMADHLIKEGQGQGETYRRQVLEKYGNYVRDGQDFALRDFRTRHSAATEAVGYGKSLMLWHDLRQRLGDRRFVVALARLARERTFQRTSFDDIEAVFSRTAEEDLGWLFDQWVDRVGSPVLEASVEASGGAARITLRQTQEGEVYRLRVPVALTRAGSDESEWLSFALETRSQAFALPAGAAVERVDVDPMFDVFRRLHREEIPPSLGSVFGAERTLLVVPASGEHLAEDWLILARTWASDDERHRVVRADEIDELPSSRAVWVLGTDNPWKHALLESPAWKRAPAPPDDDSSSFVYVLRHPADPELAVGWIGTGNAAAIPGLARKLPHYGKYGHLRFEGDEPTNSDKGQWGTEGSPLVWIAPGAEGLRGSLPDREPLAERAPVFDPARLGRHVDWLADPAREGRGVGTAGGRAAEDYVARAFAEAGLEPGGEDGTFFQSWTEADGPGGRPVEMRNVVGLLRGSEASWGRQSVVLGAHLDHLGTGWPDVRSGNEGVLHPGADDNASGVAVLIEMARRVAMHGRPRRSIVFVAFAGEEWGLRGSAHYVSAESRHPAKEALAMINLDSVGRLGEGQLQVLGTGTATQWPHVAMGIGFTTGIQSKAIAKDPGGSDQVSFHAVGVPAVQLFTGAHADYHAPGDVAAKVDLAGLVQVAAWTQEALLYLADRAEPFTVTLPETAEAVEVRPAKRTGRRVSLGTVPDFAFAGPGVRVADVVGGSAAEVAGIQSGDVLLALGDVELRDLRGYSEALKALSPGDRVVLRVFRAGQELELPAVLQAR